MINLERRLFVLTRYSTLAAVIGSLFGAFLMFFFGLKNIYDAYEAWLLPYETREGVSRSAYGVISVIEGLDRFLIAIVLLYFGYGVYSLFVRTESTEKDLGLPPLLRVRQIGQLKQVVAEVIIVVLFVLFLRTALQAYQRSGGAMDWDQAVFLLVLPVCTTLLALALKLVQLHPKPQSTPTEDEEVAEGEQTARDTPPPRQ